MYIIIVNPVRPIPAGGWGGPSSKPESPCCGSCYRSAASYVTLRPALADLRLIPTFAPLLPLRGDVAWARRGVNPRPATREAFYRAGWNGYQAGYSCGYCHRATASTAAAATASLRACGGTDSNTQRRLRWAWRVAACVTPLAEGHVCIGDGGCVVLKGGRICARGGRVRVREGCVCVREGRVDVRGGHVGVRDGRVCVREGRVGVRGGRASARGGRVA